MKWININSQVRKMYILLSFLLRQTWIWIGTKPGANVLKFTFILNPLRTFFLSILWKMHFCKINNQVLEMVDFFVILISWWRMHKNMILCTNFYFSIILDLIFVPNNTSFVNFKNIYHQHLMALLYIWRDYIESGRKESLL